MSEVINFNDLREVASHLRNDLTRAVKQKSFILLFAHNGTGKTRLSMEFKELGKVDSPRDTLYFNAFTEDLFIWHNDLDNDTNRHLTLNKDSAFFDVLDGVGTDLNVKIESFFQNYVDVRFDIDYDNGIVKFSRSYIEGGEEKLIENIKISRGEENLFIWSFFLAICQLSIDKDPAYDWVKHIYIDDPISSLDENKSIAVACDLANLIKQDDNEAKFVISTHHSLFFNVMFNEMGRKKRHQAYYLHSNSAGGHYLQNTQDTPFFHHVASLSELKRAMEEDELFTYHFNAMRSILEKTASFLGYDKIEKCIHGFDTANEDDAVYFERALNLFSHGKYSVFDPTDMTTDNKELFKRILEGFLNKYEFDLPEIFNEETIPAES